MNSIKNNKPSKKSGFVQGYLNLNECRKYKGIGPIIYRSSWEKKFCLYCERTPEIIEWSSESFFIKYFSPLDQKYHNYFPDYVIHLSDGSSIIIEIKPKSQLIKPIPPKKPSPKAIKNYKWAYETWLINMVKKEAAEEFAKSKGWKYQIINEDFFKSKK